MCSSGSDIITVTETWLTGAIYDFEVFPHKSDFSISRCDRLGKRGGGVLLAFRRSLDARVVIVPNIDLEMVWLSVKISFFHILFCVCYRAPNCSSFVCQFADALAYVNNKFSEAKMKLILGDFNYPSVGWSSNSASASEAKSFS